MYKMSHIHRCNNCNTRCNTKRTYELHVSMCDFIHQRREIDTEIHMPSQQAMFQYMIDLTNKCKELEKKVAKIQSSTTRFRRKHIDEYLKNIPPPKMEFSDWLSEIEVTYDHLKIVFDQNLEECIKEILSPFLSDLPIRAFIQNQTVFYIYHQDDWRQMTGEEMSSFITSISRKVLKTYTKWSKDNYDHMHSNTKMQELGMLYMKKVNGMDKSADTRISTIKKWLFSKIAISLNNIDFN